MENCFLAMGLHQLRSDHCVMDDALPASEGNRLVRRHSFEPCVIGLRLRVGAGAASRNVNAGHRGPGKAHR
jgi:hypothetical protein